MRWVLLAAALSMAGLTACAPRNNRTHFDRWADETKKRHAEEAQEKAEEKAAAPVAKKQAEPPRTGAVKTATKASQQKSTEDDAIY
jgi:hypothetical protein